MKQVLAFIVTCFLMCVLSANYSLAATPNQIQPYNLVRYYTMNQSSGTTVPDNGTSGYALTGSGIDWVNINAATYAVKVSTGDSLSNANSIGGGIDSSTKASVFIRLNATNTPGPNNGISIIEKNGQGYLYLVYRDGAWKWRSTLGGVEQDDSINSGLALGTEYDLTYTYDGSYVRTYVNGNLTNTIVRSGAYPSSNNGIDLARHDGIDGGWTTNFTARDVAIWNITLNASEISLLTTVTGALNLSNFNCTSSAPAGDVSPPYTTDDTTPTFKFSTNYPAYCRISNLNLTYAGMGSNRSCTSGENDVVHTCTLTVQDELVNPDQFVFLACLGLSEASIGLQMQITSIYENSSAAIERGIQSSAIWPGATIYTNQQVYMRTLANDQKLGTAEKVAAYGNQRWIFHYYNETGSPIGFFNITPAVYSLEISNKSMTEIQSLVSGYINSTKR